VIFIQGHLAVNTSQGFCPEIGRVSDWVLQATIHTVRGVAEIFHGGLPDECALEETVSNEPAGEGIVRGEDPKADDGSNATKSRMDVVGETAISQHLQVVPVEGEDFSAANDL
jgi:hypothetical protein